MVLHRIRNRYRIARAIPGYYLKAATDFGFHPLKAARAVYASLAERYMPSEAYKLGLLRPGADARTDRRYLSKWKMSAIQQRLNPASWEVLLADKSLFYRYCEASGLPTPQLFGIFLRNGGGWTSARGAMAGEAGWIDYFSRETPERIVIKPSLGAYGRGIRLLEKTGGNFRENGKRLVTAAGLVRELMSDGSYDSYVVQQQIFNRPEIIALGGSEGLQTARLFSIADGDGSVRIIYAFFKVIVGANLIDNFAGGTTGNLIARVRPADGTLYPAVTYGPEGGFLKVPAHPVTGVTIGGFRLPLWPDVMETVQRAAVKFLPLRSIGWDVAMAPADGAVIIEGNHSSDPPTSGECMDEFLQALLGREMAHG